MSNQNLQNSRVDLLSVRTLNLSGRQAKNAGDATDAQDFVTLGQLPGIVKATVGLPKKYYYTIVFSSGAVPVVVGDAVASPYGIGRGREGYPFEAHVEADITGAPAGSSLKINFRASYTTLVAGVYTDNIVGDILTTDLELLVGNPGPISTRKMNPITLLQGYRITPRIKQVGTATLISVSLIVEKSFGGLLE